MASITIGQIIRELTELTEINLNGYLEGDDLSGSTGGSYKVKLALLKEKFNEGAVTYVGTWNASLGSPPSLTPVKGQYWVVNVSGNTILGGISDWQVKDWAIYNGSDWEKVDNSDQYIESWGVKYLNPLVPTISNVEEALDLTFSGITSLSTSLSSEISTFVSIDYLLSTSISIEISDRISGDTSLSTSLSSEISTRTGADTSLSTSISIEISDRISGDTSLLTVISNEISTRTDSDLSLSTAISIISGATLEMSTIMGDDQVLGFINGNLTGVSYDTIVSSEASIRTSSDTSLSTSIDTKLSLTGGTMTGGITGITINLTNEIVSTNTRKITLFDITSGLTSYWDMNSGCSARLVITGDTTLNILNVVSGDNGTLIITQWSTGTFYFPPNSKYAGGTSHTLSGNGQVDILSFYYDGTNYYWNIGKNYA